MKTEPSNVYQETTCMPHPSLDETCIHGQPLNPNTTLGSISKELLAILEPHFQQREFRTGEHLICQGDQGDCLYVVLKGRVKIFSQEDTGAIHQIAHAGPGDVLGEMALLTGEARSAHAVADEDVTALSLSAKTVHHLTEQYPALSQLMTDLVAKRLGSVEYDALAGKSLGGFRLNRRLGKGGMSVVYEATDPAIEQTVALKMMSHRLVHDPRARKRFEREFDIVRSFDSPYIVKTWSRFAAFHSWFLVMEYCDGCPLDQWFSHAPISEAKVLRVFYSISMALEYAHQRGVVHRDVKPANMIESSDGTIKLMDFGLAQPVDEIESTKGLTGTVFYLAPELVAGKPPTLETDYFALGMTLLELLTGERLIQSGSISQVLGQIRRWKKPDIVALRPDISQEFSEQIADLLDPDPANRIMRL